MKCPKCNREFFPECYTARKAITSGLEPLSNLCPICFASQEDLKSLQLYYKTIGFIRYLEKKAHQDNPNCKDYSIYPTYCNQNHPKNMLTAVLWAIRRILENVVCDLEAVLYSQFDTIPDFQENIEKLCIFIPILSPFYSGGPDWQERLYCKFLALLNDLELFLEY